MIWCLVESNHYAGIHEWVNFSNKHAPGEKAPYQQAIQRFSPQWMDAMIMVYGECHKQ